MLTITTMKNIILSLVLSVTVLFAIAQETQHVIDWKMATLPHIQETKGNPRHVQTLSGGAVAFDGIGDAYFLGVNPLNGMDKLTLEVVFKPDHDGSFAQRFLHFGTVLGERIMFEIRVNRDSTWYFDAHTALANRASLTLIDEKLTHKTGRWYSAALVIDGEKAAVYIDGIPERSGSLAYMPINGGTASIGVRQNLVDWFKGSIFRIRITPRALTTKELLKDHHKLNNKMIN